MTDQPKPHCKLDEKRLDQFEGEVKGPFFSYGIMGFPIEEAKELIRLARLGLWAEKHGIPFVHAVERPRYLELGGRFHGAVEGARQTWNGYIQNIYYEPIRKLRDAALAALEGKDHE